MGGARFSEGVSIFLRKLCGGARIPGVRKISCDTGSKTNRNIVFQSVKNPEIALFCSIAVFCN